MNKEVLGNSRQNVVFPLNGEISLDKSGDGRSMNVRERIKTIYQKARFYWEHETTPEMVDHAKKVISGNNNLIQLYMDLGEVTDERLVEIRKDGELQNRYTEIMRSFGDGEEKNQESRLQLLSMPIDEVCGWLEYFQETYEKRFNTELISPEEKARCR